MFSRNIHLFARFALGMPTAPFSTQQRVSELMDFPAELHACHGARLPCGARLG
jgi:hypothetical protein